MKNKPILTNSPLGQEILAYLREKLNLPDYCKSLSVHFRDRDIIRVECEFMPVQQETEYRIVED